MVGLGEEPSSWDSAEYASAERRVRGHPRYRFGAATSSCFRLLYTAGIWASSSWKRLGTAKARGFHRKHRESPSANAPTSARFTPRAPDSRWLRLSRVAGGLQTLGGATRMAGFVGSADGWTRRAKGWPRRRGLSDGRPWRPVGGPSRRWLVVD
jgi:hypothetical protein